MIELFRHNILKYYKNNSFIVETGGLTYSKNLFSEYINSAHNFQFHRNLSIKKS